MEIIVSDDWGRAGELALALGWRPCGRHFLTPQGKEGRMASIRDDFTFWPTRGSILHVVPPLLPSTQARAQYVLDMGRATALAYAQ